jgi:hypothetical protein
MDDDPEKRIAELERQLAAQKRIAELERQLAQAKAAAREDHVGEQPPADPGIPPGPRLYIAPGANVTFGENVRFGRPHGDVTDSFSATSDAEWQAAQLGNAASRPLRRAAFDAGRLPRRLQQAGFPAAPVDSRLAPAPRRIPVAFWLAELLPFRWWVHVWILAMVGFVVGLGLITVWVHIPVGFSVVAVLTLVAIYAFNFLGTLKRFALLKWGQVATVTGTQILSRATYYSGTTWSNVPLPVARGWKVERPMYSGPGTKTRIRYTINGSPGELVVSGREYYDGVVLADPRNPARALCVTSFPYDLDRDESGNWIGRIRPRLKVQMVIWLIVVIGWLALAVGIAVAAAVATKNGITYTVD